VDRLKQRFLAERPEQIIHRAVFKSLQTRRPSACAVMKITGISGNSAANRRRSSSPLIHGLRASSIRRRVSGSLYEFKNSSAEENASTAKPKDLIKD
jgi:hypothetical protein